MIAVARLAAYRALRAVNAGESDLPAALARVRATLTDPRDDALASDISTGTLRWQAALDHLVDHASRRPPARLDPEVLDILRLSAYQLLHHARVPAHAIVDDAVALARRARKASAVGFVNAVLRRIDRERGHLPLPGLPATGERDRILDYLSVTLSHPRWLAARWLDRHGLDRTIAWEQFNDAPAPLVVRVNRRHGSRDQLVERLARHGVRTERTRYAPDGLVVTAGHPLRTPLAGSGAFVIQDEAAQLVTLLAAARPGERVLDACASPGGKTIALADDLQDRGLLVAADTRRRRLDLLVQVLHETGVSGARIVRLDLQAGLPFSATFDCVLADVPCSGLGVIRRDPEIRWRRTETDLARLRETQIAMLARAAEGVRPGGRLIYATCSSEPEENEEVVAAFLRDHPAFQDRDPRGAGVPIPPGLDAVMDDTGRLRTSPPEHGLDAFFAALLVRRA